MRRVMRYRSSRVVRRNRFVVIVGERRRAKVRCSTGRLMESLAEAKLVKAFESLVELSLELLLRNKIAKSEIMNEAEERYNFVSEEFHILDSHYKFRR